MISTRPEQDRVEQDNRVVQDRVAQALVAHDRLAQGRLAHDRVAHDRDTATTGTPPLSSRSAAALIDAADRAGRSWADVPLADRLAVLRRFRRALAADAETVAACIGRRPPATTVIAEIWPLLEACRFLERRAPQVLGRRTPRPLGLPWPGRARVRITRDPHGVVLIIGPGNYGLMLAAIQALQALAAGNAVIVKPAPGAGAALARFADLLGRAGLHPGVLTITDERPESAEALLEGPIDHVVFTGSGRVGRRVLERASAQGIAATMELSGWDACIVLDDADLDRVADALVFALRLNDGETCVAPRRVIVMTAQARALERRVAARLSSVPLRTFPAGQHDADATRLIRDALDAGARVVSGRVDPDGVRGPLVLSGVTADMRVFRTEIFAPLLLLCRADSEDDAVTLANHGDHGLGASVFGSRRRARSVAARLDCGLVTIDDIIVPLATAEVPLAPRGASGFGVTRGAEGLLAMTRPKATTEPRLRFAPHYQPQTPRRARALAAFVALVHGNVETQLRALRELAASTRPDASPLDPDREQHERDH